MKPTLKGSTVLITGGTGSWGQELTAQLLEKFGPNQIRIYSRNESKQVEMKRLFNDKRLKFVIGDVRDQTRLIDAARGVDYVFHTAALKHVTICEENPWETVLTNIVGTQNVINACIENKVKKMVDISSDKAVDPLNLYGICKACGERLTISANNLNSSTTFVCVRGGNVLGTSGSVVPLFAKQIKELNMITLTDERMTRFLFLLSDAIRLVLKAFFESVGGETYVMKMPACYIKDLAEVMVKELGDHKTKIEMIGIRPGEKIDEVLVSKYESGRTIDLQKYYVILPLIKNNKADENYINMGKMKTLEFTSKSTKILEKKEIKEILKTGGFLNKECQPDEIISLLTRENLINIAKKEKWVV